MDCYAAVKNNGLAKAFKNIGYTNTVKKIKGETKGYVLYMIMT